MGSLVDRAIWPGFHIGGYSPGVRRQMIGGADLAVWQSGDRWPRPGVRSRFPERPHGV